MSRFFLVILLALVLSSEAFATGGNSNGPKGGDGGNASALAGGGDARSDADAAALALAGAKASSSSASIAGSVSATSTDVNVGGDRITNPTASAAPVFAGSCASGVSAQGAGFGGSIASTNPVCDYVAVAGAYAATGDAESAARNLAKAEKAADMRAGFSKFRSIFTLGLF